MVDKLHVIDTVLQIRAAIAHAVLRFYLNVHQESLFVEFLVCDTEISRTIVSEGISDEVSWKVFFHKICEAVSSGVFVRKKPAHFDCEIGGKIGVIFIGFDGTVNILVEFCQNGIVYHHRRTKGEGRTVKQDVCIVFSKLREMFRLCQNWRRS